MNLVVHDSIDSIIKSIDDLLNNRTNPPSVPTYFTGYPTRDFDSIIMNAMDITS